MDVRKLPAWVGIGVALIALAAWSAWQRWEVLTATPYPVGIDGFFYPIQLRALLADGALAYPASPLAFWLMAPLAAATDPVTGAKLGAAVLGALIALPTYAVGTRLGGGRGAGLIAAVLATTSAGSMFLTIEFVKNGVGLTIAVTALWLVLRALEARTRARIAAAVAGVVATLLAHKLAAALVVALAIPAVLADLAARSALRGRRLLYVIGVLGAVGVTSLVLGLTFPERFLSPTDAGLVARLWTTDADWRVPALRLPRATLTMGHEAAIGAVLAVVALALVARPRPAGRARGAWRIVLAVPRLVVAAIARLPHGELGLAAGPYAVLWAVAVLALAIGLPWLAVDDPQGLGFRLRIVAFVPMALCAAAVAGAVGRALATPRRDAVLAAVALALLVVVPTRRTEGEIVPHPAMVAAVQALTGHVPAGDVVIVPERHIAFMVAWYTRAEIRLRPEGVPRARRWRLLPLAFIRAGSPLDHALVAARAQPELTPPRGLHALHPNGLVLVAEPTWEWALAQLPPAQRAYYERWPTI